VPWVVYLVWVVGFACCCCAANEVVEAWVVTVAVFETRLTCLEAVEAGTAIPPWAVFITDR